MVNIDVSVSVKIFVCNNKYVNMSKTGSPKILDAAILSPTISPAKLRGAITTFVTGSLAALFNYIGIQIGLKERTSAILSIYIIGNMIAYIADIVFAKDTFLSPNGSQVISVPYSDLGFRLKWLFKSFISSYFFRFCVTIIIDTLVGLVILMKTIDFLDDNEIHFWMRDTLLTGIIAVFTFILYNNVLRFDWAYSDVRNPLMDVIVLMWCSLALMIFSLTYNRKTIKD